MQTPRPAEPSATFETKPRSHVSKQRKLLGVKQDVSVDVEFLFEEAIAIANAGERREFVERATQDSTDQRQELVRLVDSYFSAGEFMCRPATVVLDDGPKEDGLASKFHQEAIGDQVGPYLLTSELGRGGMAIVYRAVQSEPIKREVALKIIRPGSMYGQLIARMELERQALAVMDHPNIARFFDAGVTPWGHPYYAMELVDGVSIAVFCKSREVPLTLRLRLMIDVCSAVEHAHRKGIIHRDIKPSNILVKQIDGDSKIKVIDFGIAKAVEPNSIGEQLPEAAGTAELNAPEREENLTELGQLVGTPQYMSPEQASFDTNSVDTRCDIYSIGAVLYELLTGEPPFARGNLLQILNQIQSTVPPPPSRVDRSLHLDLNAICLKCLEKNPNARYQSANSLALELNRFLSGHPVHARRTSGLARIGRWAARSPLVATFAGLSICALISLLIMWASFTYQLKAQRDEIASTAQQLSEERTHALQNFQRAHRAIKESLSIRSHTPLGSSEQLLFQKHLLKTGIEFYGELLRENEAGDELHAAPAMLAVAHLERARLYFEYGKVLVGAHENDAALQAFASAKSLAQRFDEFSDDATRIDAKKLQGVVLTSMVKVHSRLGHHASALDAARQGLKKYRELIETGELTDDYARWYQALSWNRIGQAQVELSAPKEARRSFERAHEFCGRLPAIYDFQLTHSDVLLDLARLSRLEGKLEDALATANKALAIAEDTCLRSTPPLKRYQISRIRCLSERAQCLTAVEQPAAAQVSYQRAIQFQQVLVEKEPESEQFALELADLYDQQAGALRRGNDKETSKLAAKASAIRHALDNRLLDPERILIVARMRLDHAAYDLGQHSYSAAARQFHEALQLLKGISAEHKSAIVSQLTLGAEYRLADAYFNAMEYAKALVHYQNYFKMTDGHSPGDRTAFAVCIAAGNKPENSAELLSELDAKLPNSNRFVAYVPLVQMLNLAGRKSTDVAPWQQAATDFRLMMHAFEAMSDQQKLNAAFSLCQAVECVSNVDIRGLDDFCNWAKRQAEACLRAAAGDSIGVADHWLASDPRLSCLADEPTFQRWVSTIR